MFPPLTADAASVITWSLETNRPRYFYIDRLGLPQLAHKKITKGRPEFSGSSAENCKALYQHSCRIVNTVRNRFHTKVELRNAALNQRATLTAQIAEPLLSEYGPIIWSASEPYSTCICPDYPQYLKHNKSDDRERIMLYLYCWILSRVIRKLPKTRRPSESRAFDLSSDDDDESDHTTADSDMEITNVNLRQHSAEGEVLTENNSPYPDAVRNPLVPVAQMLPIQGNNDSKTDQSTSERSATDNNVSTTSVNNQELVHDDETNNSDEPLVPHIGNRRIKRRGYSTIHSPLSQSKRQKMSLRKPIGVIHAESMRNDGAPHTETNIQDKLAGTVYPSPPPVQCTGLDDVVGKPNFPNVQHNKRYTNHLSGEETLHKGAENIEQGKYVGANSNIVAEDVADDCNVGNSDEREGDGDAGSVQGRLEEPPTRSRASKTTASSSVKRPRLVVPIKLTAQSRDLEAIRKRLASKLLDVLPVGLQQPNALILSSTVDLLQSLSRMDRQRLMEIYDKDLSNHRGALDRWLQCLRSLLTFYELTGFKDGLMERDAFLGAMVGRLPYAVANTAIHTRASLEQWRIEHNMDDEDFSRDVASILFNLASWGPWMDLQQIEDWTRKFTEDLLAWFT